MKKKMKSEFLNRHLRGLLIALISAFVLFSNTAAQSGTAILHGEISTVTPDGSSLYLSGAKIILTGASSPGEAITIFADESGSYQFKNLNVGKYLLEVSLVGFKAATKEISVVGDQDIAENVRLELDSVSASVTIESENNGINTTESTVAETISPKTLQNAPLNEEKFEDALPLIPGVVRGPDGLMNVKGAQSSQSGTLVGNSNGDDPITGNSAIRLPLEAVESLQVLSNPYSAEYGNFNGGMVQLQTRSGSDKWKAGLNSFFPRIRSRNGSIRGIESITPRFNVGGPLIKDKLFLFQTLEYKFVQTQVENLPQLEGDTKLESFNSFTRVDYNVSDNHRLNASFNIFPQKIDFINLNTFNPQNTAANFHQRGWMAAFNDQYVTNKGGILQTTFSVKRADADVFGNSGNPFTIAPQTNSGGFFNRQSRESLRTEAQSIYSLPLINAGGQHSFKVGGGFSYSTFDGSNLSQPVRIVRADGTLNQLQTYLGSGILSRNKSEFGFFVQDKWTINPRLTFDLGIRFDRDNLAESFNPAPRLGFVISPFQDNKTVIRGGFGVFFSKIPLNVGVFDQTQSVLISRFAVDGITPNGQTLFRPALENGEIETPYSLGWNLQFDREVNDRLFVRVGYEQRETRRDLLLTPILNQTGTEGIYQLGKGGSSSYREFLLMSRLRLQKNSDLFFSYTRSRSVGDLNIFGSFAGNVVNPIVRPNQYSRLNFDAPDRFLFWGEFGLPWGINLSPVIDWRTGFPYSLIDQNQNFIGRRNAENRFPDFFSADVQIFRDFKVGFRGKEYKLRAGVKFFNLTNHFNPRDVQNNLDSPDFGTFYNSVSRKTRFKFEFNF